MPPTITYGSIPIELSPDGVYLLLEAELEDNMPYLSSFFIEKIKGVSGISMRRLHANKKQRVETVRTEMINRAEITDCVTLSGLKPIERTIDAVANGK